MFIRAILLTFIIFLEQWDFSIQQNIMYPYGPSSNDISLNLNDDDSYGPIEVQFSYFDTTYSTIYINSNGFISFISPKIKSSSPKEYPISTPIISPFWSDIDTEVGGQIYYRESSSSSDLNQAEREIAKGYSTSFSPSRLYIITWDQVAAYDGDSSVNNTFQLVLATDGNVSFIVCNFGEMSWPSMKFLQLLLQLQLVPLLQLQQVPLLQLVPQLLLQLLVQFYHSSVTMLVTI